jgi:hypothetical protein
MIQADFVQNFAPDVVTYQGTWRQAHLWTHPQVGAKPACASVRYGDGGGFDEMQ